MSSLQDRLDRQKQRLRLEQHAFPAPERPVVHGLVPVGRPIPQIVYANLDCASVARPHDHATLERSLEALREDREHMKNHAWFSSFNPAGKPTTMRRASGS